MRVVLREVIMKLKPSYIKRVTEVNQILGQVARHAHEIPDVLHVATARAGDGISAMLVITVSDEEALERYNEHPAREKMVELANEISEDFVIMDYVRST
jgi:hypothetical protein